MVITVNLEIPLLLLPNAVINYSIEFFISVFNCYYRDYCKKTKKNILNETMTPRAKKK